MTDLGPLRVLAFGGGEWVIYLLLACSVLTIAIIVDRFMVIKKEERFFGGLRENLSAALDKGDLALATSLARQAEGVSAHILSAGLRRVAAGPPAVEEYFTAARLQEKKVLERRLLILGSLGNNAPFIGLFGTVLGVIKAFHDLAATASAGPEVVMKGLSEALVATAVGLLVAIPAVMAYNFFQKRVNDLLADTESLARTVLAHLRTSARGH